ncbi:MAG: YHS domain-containing protein, partial [Gammaproteobacteria bacterium]|nr:YHS domain-containing protein [Gammaproteobacteria bacterium]
MIKDPVCGMTVSADSKHHHKHEDKDYYFCSSSCHDKFVADPEQYLAPESLKDPVCGMDVSADSKHHHKHG